MKFVAKGAILWIILLSVISGSCSIGSTADKSHESPALSEVQRRDAALISVLQCLINSKKIPDDHLVGQSWLKDEVHVSPNAQTVLWANEHAGTTYGGKTLLRWEEEATAAWPEWKCPFPVASASVTS